MKNPKFSIIIPVYNVAPYLRECLDSVLAQTYTDWEAICVDDGSTDCSGMILDEYAARDSRFRVIHQSNAGVSAARNVALDKASGEWIVFLDPDDWIDADTLVRIINSCASEVVDICVYGYCPETNDPSVRFAVIPDESGGVYGSAEILSRQGELKIEEPMALLLNKAYRRSVVERRKIRFVEGMKYYEDLLFSYQTIASSDEVILIHGFTPYHVRVRPGSAVRTMKDEDHICALTLISELNRFASDFAMVSLIPLMYSYSMSIVFKMSKSRMFFEVVTRDSRFYKLVLPAIWRYAVNWKWRLVVIGLYSPRFIQKLVLSHI